MEIHWNPIETYIFLDFSFSSLPAASFLYLSASDSGHLLWYILCNHRQISKWIFSKSSDSDSHLPWQSGIWLPWLKKRCPGTWVLNNKIFACLLPWIVHLFACCIGLIVCLFPCSFFLDSCDPWDMWMSS